MYVCVHKQLREKVTELGHLEMREYMKALGGGRIERSETGSGARWSRIQILVVPLTLWLLTSHMTSHSFLKHIFIENLWAKHSVTCQ